MSVGQAQSQNALTCITWALWYCRPNLLDFIYPQMSSYMTELIIQQINLVQTAYQSLTVLLVIPLLFLETSTFLKLDYINRCLCSVINDVAAAKQYKEQWQIPVALRHNLWRIRSRGGSKARDKVLAKQTWMVWDCPTVNIKMLKASKRQIQPVYISCWNT